MGTIGYSLDEACRRYGRSSRRCNINALSLPNRNQYGLYQSGDAPVRVVIMAFLMDISPTSPTRRVVACLLTTQRCFSIEVSDVPVAQDPCPGFLCAGNPG